MEVVHIPTGMMTEFRAKTASLLGEFLKKCPGRRGADQSLPRRNEALTTAAARQDLVRSSGATACATASGTAAVTDTHRPALTGGAAAAASHP